MSNQNFQTVSKLREWFHFLKKDLKPIRLTTGQFQFFLLFPRSLKRSWLNKCGIIWKFAIYGFRLGRSTSHAIQSFLEIIYKKLDNSEVAQTVFLDYSKAFDTINQDNLLRKLKFYHFSLKSGNSLKSYLSYCKRFVKINDISSDNCAINKAPYSDRCCF